jgi:hypothetical protein
LDRSTDPFYEPDHIAVRAVLNIRANALSQQGRRKKRQVYRKTNEPTRCRAAKAEWEHKMKGYAATLAIIGFLPAAAAAQDAIPDLKGTWRGVGKILLYGNTEHLSGAPGAAVIRDLDVSHTVIGQEGRLLWGTTSSTNNDSKEPFAWAMSSDNKTILGADTDGYYRLTVVSADRIEKCYVQNSAGPRQAIVATCFMMNKVKN